MPIYDKDSAFAAKRDQVLADIARQKELREAVEREPDRFITPERFAELAAQLDDEN